jgi:hypothetical protein
MTTLLDLCTLALNDIGLVAPMQIVSNTDETAVRVLAAAQMAGKSLFKAPQGGWVASIKEYDFATAAVAQQAGTITIVGGFAVISGLANIGAITPGAWYAFGTGVPGNAIVTAVTSTTVTLNKPPTALGAGFFAFGQSDYPLPSDFHRPIDDTLWDRSRFWSMRGPLSPQQWQLFKSSVIGKASIQRRFRFRTVNGAQVFSIDPVPTDNGSALVFEYVSKSWCQSAGGTPQTLWLMDSDVPTLDEDLLLLGIRWRVKRGLGFTYNDERDEYETELRKAMARDGGAPVLSLTPSNGLALLGPWNVPETGFGDVGAFGSGFGGGFS